MASIRWYRGSGRRVLNPRRDKPTAPKDLPKKKKPRRLGLPRSPKFRAPRIKLPFVQARNTTTFNANLSSSGISSVMDIAEKNGLKIGNISWHLSGKGESSGSGKGLSCANSALGKTCLELSHETWNSIGDFIRECQGGNPQDSGIWAISHVNCTCWIKMTLFDQKNPDVRAIYNVYTDSAAAEGDSDGTSRSGYNLVREESQIPEGFLGLSPVADDARSKTDSPDEARREQAKKDRFQSSVMPEELVEIETAEEVPGEANIAVPIAEEALPEEPLPEKLPPIQRPSIIHEEEEEEAGGNVEPPAPGV